MPAGDPPGPVTGPAPARQPTRAQLRAAREQQARGAHSDGTVHAGGTFHPGDHRHHHHQPQHRPRRPTPLQRALAWLAVLAVLGVVVTVLVLVVGGISRVILPPAPKAVVTVHLPAAPAVPAATGDVALPWPSTGQAAVAVPAVGYTAQSGPEHPVPVASMTKVVTAYVILHDHPMTPGQDGPAITVSADDVDDYDHDTVTDQANVPLQAGETLTERQMLQGLLVHSANDLAYSLATWDAGSLPAFVAKMNAAAATLGMTQSHFADASGYTPGSVSTPADLLKVAVADMANPTFAQIVAMPSVTLPVAGTVSSYTPLLPGGWTDPTPGVIGVKSGFTDAAGGGDILAYQASVGGQTFVVLAAVTSFEMYTVLRMAGKADLAVAQAAASHVVAVTLPATGSRAGTVELAGKRVPLATAATGTLVAWPGQTVTQAAAVTDRHPRAGIPAGHQVGTVTWTLGQQRLVAPVRTMARMPRAS
ncbi:MAG TPA: hypothetical protein VHB02_09740 [Acidimicrobiales bacterium]|nr:hypothetical protein [Acidimicrobiales bacterium]